MVPNSLLELLSNNNVKGKTGEEYKNLSVSKLQLESKEKLAKLKADLKLAKMEFNMAYAKWQCYTRTLSKAMA